MYLRLSFFSFIYEIDLPLHYRHHAVADHALVVRHAHVHHGTCTGVALMRSAKDDDMKLWVLPESTKSSMTWLPTSARRRMVRDA